MRSGNGGWRGRNQACFLLTRNASSHRFYKVVVLQETMALRVYDSELIGKLTCKMSVIVREQESTAHRISGSLEANQAQRIGRDEHACLAAMLEQIGWQSCLPYAQRHSVET